MWDWKRLESVKAASLMLGIFGGCASPEFFEAYREPAAATATKPNFQLKPTEFLDELRSRRARLVEFEYIRKWGAERGVRIFAAGGSAAGYAHYIQDDLEREWRKSKKLPLKHFESRFDYDYYDVFRSTQDADIVIDLPNGSVEDHERIAVELENDLQSKFGYLQGSKSVWEVRTLRVDRGVAGEATHKDALLSKDFLEQNSDSHSTGLIELTDSEEPVLRDVRDWKNAFPKFGQDVLDGELTFYKSAKHFSTRRAKAGINPEILSVIRYYTKAFQYGLKIRKEDEAALRRIIKEFDPTDISDSYVLHQLERNGLKLFWHAQDVENAWNVLERVGLRRKMIQVGDTDETGSMSAWLNREPLRAKAVGGGKGKTARALGIDVIAHETDQYLSYESITRSVNGVPNVFISRSDAPGEAAMHGDGFYTRIGREGARDTGFTIRFKLNPAAREGTDFLIEKDFVIILNRNAVSVIEESLTMTPLQFVRTLGDQVGADHSDRGLFEKMSRKIQNQLATMSADERKKIPVIIKRWLAEAKKGSDASWDKVVAWTNLPIAMDFPDLIDATLKIAQTQWQSVHFDFSKVSAVQAEILAPMIERYLKTLAKGDGHRFALIESWYASPHAAKYPELFPQLLNGWNRHSKPINAAQMTELDAEMFGNTLRKWIATKPHGQQVGWSLEFSAPFFHSNFGAKYLDVLENALKLVGDENGMRSIDFSMSEWVLRGNLLENEKIMLPLVKRGNHTFLRQSLPKSKLWANPKFVKAVEAAYPTWSHSERIHFAEGMGTKYTSGWKGILESAKKFVAENCRKTLKKF